MIRKDFLSFFLLLPLLAAVFFSCEKEVFIDIPEHESLITVNAFLENGEEIAVHVSQSGQISESIDSFLQGATVVLYADNIPDTLVFGGDHWYKTGQKASPGMNYSLRVYHPDFKEALTGDAFPAPVNFNLENFVAKDAVDDWGYIYSTIDVVFSDNSNRNDYYEIEANIGETVRHESSSTFYAGIESTDMILKNEGYSDNNQTLNFSDALFNGEEVRIKFRFAFNLNVDYVYITLRSVSENYYRYKKSLYRYEVNSFNSILNSSNPVGLFTNIENGYGIFAGYSEVTDSIYTYPEKHE
ncbi:MAG: DUF4249 domain-containing protein [Prolixibacteraceae bacterium]|nr:DUF4249 domain-containing protein [Prolixibacteraceae bacterium]